MVLNGQHFTWRTTLDAYQVTAEIEYGLDTTDRKVILLAESMQTAVLFANEYFGVTGSVKEVRRIGPAVVPVPATKEGQS